MKALQLLSPGEVGPSLVLQSQHHLFPTHSQKAPPEGSRGSFPKYLGRNFFISGDLQHLAHLGALSPAADNHTEASSSQLGSSQFIPKQLWHFQHHPSDTFQHPWGPPLPAQTGPAFPCLPLTPNAQGGCRLLSCSWPAVSPLPLLTLRCSRICCLSPACLGYVLPPHGRSARSLPDGSSTVHPLSSTVGSSALVVWGKGHHPLR